MFRFAVLKSLDDVVKDDEDVIFTKEIAFSKHFLHLFAYQYRLSIIFCCLLPIMKLYWLKKLYVCKEVVFQQHCQYSIKNHLDCFLMSDYVTKNKDVCV